MVKFPKADIARKAGKKKSLPSYRKRKKLIEGFAMPNTPKTPEEYHAFYRSFDQMPFPMEVAHFLKQTEIQIVKKRIEGGANEKAVWRLFINCPFVCINFDFFWLNKVRQLYMDF